MSYSNDVTVDIPLTYMTKEKKESAKAAVKALRATGGTALCDGLVSGTHHIAELLHVGLLAFLMCLVYTSCAVHTHNVVMCCVC